MQVKKEVGLPSFPPPKTRMPWDGFDIRSMPKEKEGEEEDAMGNLISRVKQSFVVG
jgi:hypothetical protein